MSPSLWPSPRTVWVLAKKEFMDNVRSKWIIAISAVFIILTLVVSYFGAARLEARTGLRGFEDTATGTVSLASFLVPILALMLGYAAVAGEREQGSVLLLLSMPITRLEAILGKFIGLGAVLVVAILGGLGVSGIIIAVAVGTEGALSYLAFIGGTILFALAFLSLALLVSTAAKRRSTAVGLAVLLWFAFSVIFDTVLIGIAVATGTKFDPLSRRLDLPGWMYAAEIANPTDAFGYFAFTVFNIKQTLGVSMGIPDFVTPWITSASLLAWTLIPLLLALWRFRRQDL